MTARSQWLLPLATMLSLLAACVPELDPPDYPTLVGRFADEGAPKPLIADEAWLSGTDFYVRFRRGDDIRYEVIPISAVQFCGTPAEYDALKAQSS